MNKIKCYKKPLFVLGIFIIICIIVLITVLTNIYRNAEIVHCLYYSNGSLDYYDISIYGNGKINYTHGSKYTFPLEYAQERIGKKGLKHDPIKSELYYEKEEKFLSFQDQLKSLWILIRLQFVERVDRSGISGKADRADYTIFGEKYHAVPQEDYFASDKLAGQLTEILKKYCNIPEGLPPTYY